MMDVQLGVYWDSSTHCVSLTTWKPFLVEDQKLPGFHWTI